MRPTNALTAVRANEAARLSRKGGAPLLTCDSDRETLIAWLTWNDPNGCYTDADCDREDFDRLDLQAAWELIAEGES